VLSRLWKILRGAPSKVETSGKPAENFFVTTVRLFSLSPDLLGELVARRTERGADNVEREHDAFLLDPGLGPGQYLSSDGRILWDDDGWSVAATRRDAFAAILCGVWKTKIERLRELLPPRPDDAVDCEMCGSTGEYNAGGLMRDVNGNVISIICPTCAGLGWISANLALHESVLESRRAN